MTKQKQKEFEFKRGKPTAKLTREIYSRIKERWAEQDLMVERFPVKVTVNDSAIKEYVEENVHFSWSDSVNWFGDEGRRLQKVLWEMGILGAENKG